LRRRRGRGRPPWRSAADAAIFLAALLLAGLAARQAGWLQPETGRYEAIDGDSLRKAGQEYRLHGIDAPELHQECERGDGSPYPCGRLAREELRRLVSGRTLDCAVRDQDRYGRLVATCRAGGEDINSEMVRRGWAIAYRRHGMDYNRDEAAARDARRGIWQGTFTNPETWRAGNRNRLTRGATADEPAPED
jgi:endonuclease YncB( thermonuclease family)